MANDSNDIPEELRALADKLDNVIRLAGEHGGPLLVPALMVLVGRYVAYEAGHAHRIKRGLEIAQRMITVGATAESIKLYGRPPP